MQEKLTAWKAGLTALITGLTAFLGWKGIAALAWVAAMALDYISGTAAACKEGKWSSQVARDGLWHKMGMILAVLVAAIADGVLTVLCRQLPEMGIAWPGMVLPVVLIWYLLTELGSILENAVRLGAKVPAWLSKLLLAAKNQLTGEDEQTN